LLRRDVEGVEELHEDEEAAQWIVGETTEREGEYWTINYTERIGLCRNFQHLAITFAEH
jgi:hypothetical protein